MYSKQQASQLRRQCWIRFGQYMRPVAGAGGEMVNWINYRTGVKHLYFRMDADNRQASVGIELRHTPGAQHVFIYSQLEQLRPVLEEETGEQWNWVEKLQDENGQTISRISTVLEGVNIFNEADWPAIISFFKPRIMALDRFWEQVKEGFL